MIQEQPDVPAPQHESSPPELSRRLRHQPIRYGFDEYVNMASTAEDQFSDNLPTEPSSLMEALHV